MTTASPIRRALLSVSDKTGIVEFATALVANQVELLSTGGTAKLLMEKAYQSLKCLNTLDSKKSWMAVLKHFTQKFTVVF